MFNGEFKDAEHCYLKSIEQYKKLLKDYSQMVIGDLIICYRNIIVMNMKNSNYSRSLQLVEELIYTIDEYTPNTKDNINALILQADILIKLNRKTEATETLTSALELAEEVGLQSTTSIIKEKLEKL